MLAIETKADVELLPFEVERLSELEAVIEKGVQTFVDVGLALMEIKESRLYRSAHSSFESYCRGRWGFGRDYAYKTIRAAEVAAVLVESVDPGIQPVAEKHVRPLVGLHPEDVVDAWQEAVETAPDGGVTAEHVRRIAERYRAPAQKKEGPALPAPVAAAIKKAIGVPPLAKEGANALDDQWPITVAVYAPTAAAVLARRFVSEFSSMNVMEGILVTHAATDEEWFAALRRFPRCFIAKQDGPALVAFYFGPKLRAFVAAFAELGDTYVLAQVA